MINDIQLLSDTEYEIIELLQSLKVPRTESIAIACLLCGKELTSQTIERSSGLRQPEVSVAMRPLREREWIDEKNVKKTNGKGRPTKYYKLIVPLSTIINTFESEIIQNHKMVMDSITQLRELRLK
ncbi:MAG TPA: transcriptional regulator [Methanosarcinaceae archaeon]|nr:transcriptional regulator [Methanosarcinaceae archaeon]